MSTLSLCMIVKDEEEVLERCLTSVEPLVDEIVIVDTGSSDKTVQIAEKFSAAIHHFEWCHDFSKARNFSFKQATGDYILWLDADDIIETEQLQALLQLKEHFNKDVYYLKYNYSHDEYGTPTCTFFRERIIKNHQNIKWKYPVHEVLIGIDGRSNSYEDIFITHQRTRLGQNNDHRRNLTILSNAVQTEEFKHSPRIWYYYGRELFDHQHYDHAIQSFEQFLTFNQGWIEDKIGAYIKIATCYLELYKQTNTNDRNDLLFKAREAARRAIALDNRWAEPYFVLGEIAFEIETLDEAIFWFKKCIIPIPEVLSPVLHDNYNISPFVKLMFCYDKLGDYQQANFYNNKALELKPNDTGLLYNKDYFQSLLHTSKSVNQDKIRIAWYGKNIDFNFPTYRIRALQLHNALNELEYSSEMVDSEKELEPFDIVIFFKAITAAEWNVMQRMKSIGKKVVFDIAEDLFEHIDDFPDYIPLLQLADCVTCCSFLLADKIKLYNPQVYVVEDAIEPVHHISQVRDTDQLVFGWVGLPENAKHAEALRPLIESLGCKLISIHSGANYDKLWTLENWQQDLSHCDAAIAPLDIEKQSCKSNNKVSTYQSLGLPVIASPLDAYQRLIEHEVNGFIANSMEEWKNAIIQLKSTEQRKRIRDIALNTVVSYKPQRLALKFLQAVAPNQYHQSAVDIIIPTIYPTAHLSLCIDSIIACTRIPYRIIVIHNGDYSLDFLPDEVTIIKGDRLNFSASINRGIAHSNSPYICIMNDDVIVSENWLQPLVNDVHNGIDFCNPLSNCDKGFLHDYELEINGVQLGPGSNSLLNGLIIEKDIPQNGLHPSALYTYKPDIARRKFKIEWVPFFCTLIRRQTIETVGLLDDRFNNGYEDVDLCIRGKRMGLVSGVNENSFVFHFGGTSRNRFIQEHPEQEGDTQRIYLEKYNKPLMVIHAGYAYEPWNGHSINKNGLGGSETAVIKMAEAFSVQNYQVIVFCCCKNKESVINQVAYKDLSQFRHFVDRHYIDVFILSRYANFLEYPIRAAKRFVWLHDIWAMGTEHGENDLLYKHHKELDGIFCLSPWHADFVAKTHNIPNEKLILTGNGVDADRFDNKSKSIPNRFIYSSSPDRSLDKLLKLFPKIRKILPDATLHIYYGFDNWNKSIEQSNNELQKQLRDEIYELMKQEGVYYHGRVNQTELAKAFLQSDIWLYPTQFTETFCITALEAQASETLCICSDLAGLKATVGDRGILIQKEHADPLYDQHILDLITEIQNNPKRKAALLQKGKAWAQRQSWKHIAQQWLQHFDTSIKID